MKQAILNLKKKLLLQELPEGVRGINISTLGDIIFKTSGTKEILWLADDRLVKKYTGKLIDITESQYSEWVENIGTHTTFIKHKQIIEDAYKDYKSDENFYETAKESYFSYLEKEGILFSNPLDWEKKAYLFKGSENSWGHDDLKRWQEAEEKVWDRDRIYIFEILN